VDVDASGPRVVPAAPDLATLRGGVRAVRAARATVFACFRAVSVPVPAPTSTPAALEAWATRAHLLAETLRAADTFLQRRLEDEQGMWCFKEARNACESLRSCVLPQSDSMFSPQFCCAPRWRHLPSSHRGQPLSTASIALTGRCRYAPLIEPHISFSHANSVARTMCAQPCPPQSLRVRIRAYAQEALQVPTEAPPTVATGLESLAAEWAEAVHAVDTVWAAQQPRFDPKGAPTVTEPDDLGAETGRARPAVELLASDGGGDNGDDARWHEPSGPAVPAEELVFASDDESGATAGTQHEAPKLSREERIRLRRERDVRDNF